MEKSCHLILIHPRIIEHELATIHQLPVTKDPMNLKAVVKMYQLSTARFVLIRERRSTTRIYKQSSKGRRSSRGLVSPERIKLDAVGSVCECLM